MFLACVLLGFMGCGSDDSPDQTNPPPKNDKLSQPAKPPAVSPD
jgi:hypothetical protein